MRTPYSWPPWSMPQVMMPSVPRMIVSAGDVAFDSELVITTLGPPG